MNNLKLKKREQMYLKRYLNQSLLLVIGLLSILQVATASMLIWPTNLHLNGQEKSIALWVENQGTTTQILQARVYAWEHKRGDDNLVAQSNFMISPPMAKVAPGKKQLFRIVNRTGVPANKLHSYRVIIDEVPQKVNANQSDDSAVVQGVKFQFRYSIPLFVYGKGLSNDARQKVEIANILSKISWAVSTESGKNLVKVTNESDYYINLSKLSFSLDQKSDIGGYLLPGQTREWVIPGVVTGFLYGSIDNSELMKIEK